MIPTLSVDFNAGDSKYVYWLWPEAKSLLETQGLELKEGLEVIITDDELWAMARVEFHDGRWVAVIERWLDSPPKANDQDMS